MKESDNLLSHYEELDQIDENREKETEYFEKYNSNVERAKDLFSMFDKHIKSCLSAPTPNQTTKI